MSTRPCSPSVSDCASDYTGDASVIYITTEEEQARTRRYQMGQHATFRRFCAYFIERALAYSIFASRGSLVTRQRLIGKGKSRQVDWRTSADWKDINILLPGTRREYREYRVAQGQLWGWVNLEEVTYEGGLTGGDWSFRGCWPMRIIWRSSEFYDETRTSRDDHRKDYHAYSRGESWSLLQYLAYNVVLDTDGAMCSTQK